MAYKMPFEAKVSFPKVVPAGAEGGGGCFHFITWCPSAYFCFPQKVVFLVDVYTGREEALSSVSFWGCAWNKKPLILNSCFLLLNPEFKL